MSYNNLPANIPNPHNHHPPHPPGPPLQGHGHGGTAVLSRRQSSSSQNSSQVQNQSPPRSGNGSHHGNLQTRTSPPFGNGGNGKLKGGGNGDNGNGGGDVSRVQNRSPPFGPGAGPGNGNDNGIESGNSNRERSSTVVGPFPMNATPDGGFVFGGLGGQAGMGGGAGQVSMGHGQGFVPHGPMNMGNVGNVAPVYSHHNQMPPPPPIHHHQQPYPLPNRGHGGNGHPHTFHSRQASQHRDGSAQRSRNYSTSHSHPSHIQQQPLQYQPQIFQPYPPEEGLPMPYHGPVHSHPHARQLPHNQPVPFPNEISDIYTLRHWFAVAPDALLHHITTQQSERERLRGHNAILIANFEQARRDYASLRKMHETLSDIWLKKQFLFWRFVERVRKGEGEDFVRKAEGDEGAGEWIGGDGEGEMSMEEVEEMWGREPMRRFERQSVMRFAADVGDEVAVKSVGDDSPERGRSSQMTARPFRLRPELMREENELVGLTEGSVLSGGESAADSNLLRLDPSARPFVPSPTRSSARTPSQQRRASPPESTTPKVIPAIPLAFPALRDIAMKSTPPQASPTPPPRPTYASTAATPVSISASASSSTSATELKKREAQVAQAFKGAEASSASSSKDRESVRGGKRGYTKSKSDRGGKSRANSSSWQEPKTNSTPQKAKLPAQPQQETMATKLFGPSSKLSSGGFPALNPNPWKTGEASTQQKNQKENENPSSSRSPSRLSSIKNPNLLTTGSQDTSPTQKQRKVSPDLLRVSGLTFPDTAAPAPTPNYGTSTSLASFTTPMSKSKSAQTPLKKPKPLLKPTPVHLSRKKMAATLNEIPKPYSDICPFSLLETGGCEVQGCNLLHVCPVFNDDPIPTSNSTSKQLLKEKDPELEFPPLRFPPPAVVVSKFHIPSVDKGNGKAQEEVEEINLNPKPCITADGNPVQEGETCSLGKIHIRRSCRYEVAEEICPFWSSPNTPTTPDTKSKGRGTDGPRKEKSKSRSPDKREEKGERSPGKHFTASSSAGTSGRNEKEAHFANYTHERDGVGRETWHARTLNAGLRETHRCGMWGVHVNEGGDRDIKWKGGSKLFQETKVDDDWKPRVGSSSTRGLSSAGKGKGRGRSISRDEDEVITKGVKWEEKKLFTREDWAKRGGWGGGSGAGGSSGGVVK